MQLFAVSDFSGGRLKSLDTGPVRLWEREDIVRYLREDSDAQTGRSPAREAIAKHGLYLAPCNG
jgi:hypothetical protein